jgi:LacI family transcriptional regulator
MPLTLEDIARKCGVSRSTVSRVINQEANVSPDTRQRVMDVIQQINFQPNLAARGLAAGKTRVLGVVIPMGVTAIFTDPFFPLLIQGVSITCNASDYSVMLWLDDPEYERRTVRQILYNGLVDGVIVASNMMDDPIVLALGEGKLPYVMVGRSPSNKKVNFIDVDNYGGARKAVQHLLGLGRRRIAHIAGPHNLIAGLDRYQGYLSALYEGGIFPDPALLVEGDFTDLSGYAAVQRLLPYYPDAFFVASDAMANGALRALIEAGLHVPQDVSLVGFDDIPISSRTIPPLTTVHQPIQRVGSLAAQTLIEVIEHPENQPRQVVLPTELIVRGTCGGKVISHQSSVNS